MAVIPIPSEEVLFGNRNSLKRSADELSESQFELLCVASLENDLSVEQKEELDEIISGNEERRRIAGLLSRMKLIPSEHTYRYKHRLRKLTVAQKVISISAIGLSAAASVLIMFTVLKNPVTDNGYGLPATGSLEKPAERTEREAAKIVPGKKEETKLPVAGNLTAKINESVSAERKSINENITVADTTVPVSDILKNDIAMISGLTQVPQGNTTLAVSLVTMNLTLVEPFNEEEGNAVGNFFTRLIREKVLKSQTPENGNLKAYEVADAGIAGINKLFGSNMTLEKTIDEKGEVQSVYFNSKLLKFNAPVKKAEPLE